MVLIFDSMGLVFSRVTRNQEPRTKNQEPRTKNQELLYQRLRMSSDIATARTMSLMR